MTTPGSWRIEIQRLFEIPRVRSGGLRIDGAIHTLDPNKFSQRPVEGGTRHRRTLVSGRLRPHRNRSLQPRPEDPGTTSRVKSQTEARVIRRVMRPKRADVCVFGKTQDTSLRKLLLMKFDERHGFPRPRVVCRNRSQSGSSNCAQPPKPLRIVSQSRRDSNRARLTSAFILN